MSNSSGTIAELGHDLHASAGQKKGGRNQAAITVSGNTQRVILITKKWERCVWG